MFSAVIVGVTLGTRGPRDTLAAHQHNFVHFTSMGVQGHSFMALDDNGQVWTWDGLNAPAPRSNTIAFSQISGVGSTWGIGICRANGWLYRNIARLNIGGWSNEILLSSLPFSTIINSGSYIAGITTAGQLMLWAPGDTSWPVNTWTSLGQVGAQTNWVSVVQGGQNQIFAINTLGQLWRIPFSRAFIGGPWQIDTLVQINVGLNFRSFFAGSDSNSLSFPNELTPTMLGAAITTDGQLHRILERRTVGGAGVRFYAASRIGTASDWASISGNGNFAAINNAGHLFTWGRGGSGAWGDGLGASGEIRENPTRILVPHTFSQVHLAGQGMARQTNGDVWIWGASGGTTINPAVRHIQGVVTATVQFRNSQNGANLGAPVSATGVANSTQAFAIPDNVPAPTPALGYTFSHWNPSVVTRNIGNGGALAPVYVEPVFVRHAIGATFHLNGGQIGTQHTTYTMLFIEGAQTPQPRNPFRLGFSFAGWFTAASGGAPFDFVAPRTTNQTIHAQWIPLTGNVVMLHFAGGLRPDETSWTFNSDRPQTMWLPSAGVMNEFPPAFGQTFLGWYANPEFTGPIQFRVASSASGPQEFFGRWS